MKTKLCAALLASAFLAAFSSPASAQQDFALEPSPPLSSVDIPPALADRLQPQGSRVVRTAAGAHDPICDVWWVRSLDGAGQAAGSPKAIYGSFEVGELAGLLRFLTADAEDSRDQKLKPGFYTMRYAQVAPGSDGEPPAEYPDFILLSPMSADVQPARIVSFEEMSRLSTLATGTGRPALMSLVPPNPAYKNLPALVADDLGNCALQAELTAAKGAKFVVSILLVTPLKDEGGS